MYIVFTAFLKAMTVKMHNLFFPKKQQNEIVCLFCFYISSIPYFGPDHLESTIWKITGKISQSGPRSWILNFVFSILWSSNSVDQMI